MLWNGTIGFKSMVPAQMQAPSNTFNLTFTGAVNTAPAGNSALIAIPNNNVSAFLQDGAGNVHITGSDAGIFSNIGKISDGFDLNFNLTSGSIESAGIIYRYLDVNNSLFIRLTNGNNIQFQRVQSGAFALDNYSFDYSNIDKSFGVRVIGNKCTALKNNRPTSLVWTDNYINTDGYIGIVGNANDALLNSVTISAIPTIPSGGSGNLGASTYQFNGFSSSASVGANLLSNYATIICSTTNALAMDIFLSTSTTLWPDTTPGNGNVIGSLLNITTENNNSDIFISTFTTFAAGTGYLWAKGYMADGSITRYCLASYPIVIS